MVGQLFARHLGAQPRAGCCCLVCCPALPAALCCAALGVHQTDADGPQGTVCCPSLPRPAPSLNHGRPASTPPCRPPRPHRRPPQTGRGKAHLVRPRYSGLMGESLSGGFRWERDVVRLEKVVAQQDRSRWVGAGGVSDGGSHFACCLLAGCSPAPGYRCSRTARGGCLAAKPFYSCGRQNFM